MKNIYAIDKTRMSVLFAAITHRRCISALGIDNSLDVFLQEFIYTSWW